MGLPAPAAREPPRSRIELTWSPPAERQDLTLCPCAIFYSPSARSVSEGFVDGTHRRSTPPWHDPIVTERIEPFRCCPYKAGTAF